MANSNLYIVKGKNPILFSAPHSFRHKRKSMTGTYKAPEPWTDYIARNVADGLGASVITAREDMEYDPNYDQLEKNEYKAEVSKLVGDDIKYFVDFHGLSDAHSFDLGIWHQMRYGNSKKLAFDLADAVSNDALRGGLMQIFHFRNDSQETLGEYVVRNHKVPTVQIEIARYIREDDALREALIENLVSFFSQL